MTRPWDGPRLDRERTAFASGPGSSAGIHEPQRSLWLAPMVMTFLALPGDVTVADISDPLLDCARWRIDRRGLEARFIDLKRESLPRGAFDLISAVDVLEHVADPIATLEQLRDALSPGGILVFDLIASAADPERPFHLLRSKFPIRSRIRALGFDAVESFQKYVVFRRRERTPIGRAWIQGWDLARWRLYYLMQGKWPRARSGSRA